MMTFSRHRCWLSGLTFAALLMSSSAVAQSPDELKKARQIFSQGVTQEAAGDWEGALSSFQEVARIKMTPQVRYHIARSKEHLGRLNEALGGYRLAEYEASQADPQDESLMSEIEKSREALEKRIPKLTIKRGSGAEAMRIELDGVSVGEARIGTQIGVDPGPHVVVGTIGGKQVKRTIEIAESQTEEIVLDAPEGAEPAAGATPPDTPAPSGGGFSASTAGAGSSSALPWIIGGVGVAGLVASGVFYVMRKDAESDLDSGCLGRYCPDTLQDTQDKGEQYALLSGVSLGVGIVGIGVAVVMLATRSSPGPEQQPGVALNVRSEGHYQGVSLDARF